MGSLQSSLDDDEVRRREELDDVNEQTNRARLSGERKVDDAEKKVRKVVEDRQNAHSQQVEEIGKVFIERRREVREHQEELDKLKNRELEEKRKRFEETVNQKMQLANRYYQIAWDDYSDSVHRDIYLRHVALADRAHRLKIVTEEMTEMVILRSHHDDLVVINAAHNTELALFESEARDLKEHIHRSFDVDASFKEILLSPLKPLEESCTDIRSVYQKVLSAKHTPEVLGDVEIMLKKHLRITACTLDTVNSPDYQDQIQSALQNSSQLSITL